MRMPAKTVMVTMVGFLSGCAALIETKDREQICHVSVVEKYGSPAFKANPLSNPATGPALGAAGGAAAGLAFWPSLFLTIPMGTIAGVACGVASMAHPNAEAEFQEILKGANAGGLKQALQKDLDARTPECRKGAANAQATGASDTIVEIDKVELWMGCGYGKQDIFVTVHWRAMTAADRRLLGQNTTVCIQGSSSEFGEWFTDKPQARSEIDRLLVRTGQRIAGELLSPQKLPLCRFLPETTDDAKGK